jgi:hypothetical protein
MVRIYRARLVFRITVFIAAICKYINDKNILIISNGMPLSNGIKPLHILWLILTAEMMLKFFPLRVMSMGCRKQFKVNYAPGAPEPIQTEITAWMRSENAAALKVAAVWLGGNTIVALLYYAKVLGESEMVLLSLFYYVGDLICILFYCPFQSLIMKNRCCVTCRIFNWDSMMMFTPLVFIRSFFSWSLALVALCLFVQWEITYWRYPQRFFEGSNRNLTCGYCSDHLCRVKHRPVSNDIIHKWT